MTNKTNTVLYIGVTSELYWRVKEHKEKKYPGSFTARYNCNKLIYYETYTDIEEAILRKKTIKEMEKGMEN